MATYAVGDLQGCLTPLRRLLDQCNFDPATDRLWLVGDLVNRGPHSLETLQFLFALRGRVTAVLGNHDLHLLSLAAGTPLKVPPDLVPVLHAPDAGDLLSWLAHLPLLVRAPLDTDSGTEDMLLVHAGIPHCWTLATAQALTTEVAETLAEPNRATAFLRQMHGNHPGCWDDALQGIDRLRAITNYCTRMRFIESTGRLEFTTKAGPKSAPAGFRPWFEWPRDPDDDCTIVFGHWAALAGETGLANRIALDTGCAWGQRMTMMRLEDRRQYWCDCQP